MKLTKNRLKSTLKKVFVIKSLLFLLLFFGCKDEQETMIPEKKEEFVPQWAKTVVWYQIFPERFRDGDLNNNPTVEDIAGADPQEPPKAWQIHPWGSDWYKLQDYEKTNGEPELWNIFSVDVMAATYKV